MLKYKSRHYIRHEKGNKKKNEMSMESAIVVVRYNCMQHSNRKWKCSIECVCEFVFVYESYHNKPTQTNTVSNVFLLLSSFFERKNIQIRVCTPAILGFMLILPAHNQLLNVLVEHKNSGKYQNQTQTSVYVQVKLNEKRPHSHTKCHIMESSICCCFFYSRQSKTQKCFEKRKS